MRALYHTTIHWIGSTPTIFFLTKRCNTCQQDLEFEKFKTDNHQKDGLSGRCQRCTSDIWANRDEEEKLRERTQRKVAENLRREDIREYDRLRRNEKLRERKAQEQERELREMMSRGELSQFTFLPPTHKICTRCDPPILKALNEFTLSPGTSDGHHSICKACCNAYAHTKLDQRRERERRRKLADTAYVQYRREQGRAYQKLHLLSDRQRVLKRIAKKKALQIGDVNYERILERDGGFCHICQQDIIEGYPIEFDHVIPLAREGAHSEDNIKVSHRICNRIKADRLLEEIPSIDFEKMHQEVYRYSSNKS